MPCSDAEYLRNLGLGYQVPSVIDSKQVDNLLKINGDLGRLGGLLKLWLTNDKRTKLIGKSQLHMTLNGIRDTQNMMLDVIMKLKKITFGIVIFDLSSLNTMIAKIIPIKTVRKSNYSALIQYLTDPQGKSERISQIKVSNCYADDQTAALIEIQNTQEMNTRAKSDKTCHWC